jgi:phage portal protein BeeE
MPAQLHGTWRQPPRRGDWSLLEAYVASPALRSVVQRVSRAFGSQAWYVHQGSGPMEGNYNAPICSLIKNYNPRLYGRQGRELEQLYLDVCGEYIAVVLPAPEAATGVHIYPVPPTWVTVETLAGEPEYWIQRPGRAPWSFPGHQIIHRREIDLVDPYGRGRGGARALADEIEIDEYASKYAKSYYFNSTSPEFIATVKNASPTQVKALRDQYLQRHRGFFSSWQPAFVPFELDIHTLTERIGDQGIEDIRRYTSDVIRWLYGVPPEIIGVVDSSNRATIQEAQQIMGLYVVDPRLDDYRESVLHYFGPAFGDPDLRYVSSVPKIFDRRDEIMSRHAYHFTRNEVRQEAGFAAVEDGDVYALPVNLEVDQAQRTLSTAGPRTRFRIIDGLAEPAEEAAGE